MFKPACSSPSKSAVKGDVEAFYKGGTHYYASHEVLGNNTSVSANDKTASDAVIEGNVTCTVTGGYWGTFYLGSRARGLWEKRTFCLTVLTAACISLLFFGLVETRTLIDLGYVRELLRL